MINKLPFTVNIDSLQEQLKDLPEFKRLHLNETTENLFSGPYKIKKDFENTPIGQILDELGPIGEARLLSVGSGETYTAHTDPDDRIHIPLITNNFCYLLDLDDKKFYHLPADGSVYLMDTSKMHVACNFGPRNRIHINIRKLLPKFVSPGYQIKIYGGDYDWKQILYNSFMGFVNQNVKNKIITGIAKVDDRTLLFNTTQEVIFEIKRRIEKNNFECVITEI